MESVEGPRCPATATLTVFIGLMAISTLLVILFITTGMAWLGASWLVINLITLTAFYLCRNRV